jgi:hypothetical protein
VAASAPANENQAVEALRRALEDYLYELDPALDLTMVAANALVRGLDSPALAELAGLSKDSAYEIRELLPAVVAELSIEVSPLPDAVFRKAGETAREYLAGDLGFLPAARRVAGLMYGPDYLDFADRPDVGLAPFDDLWLLNEWLFAVDHGHEHDSAYSFRTPGEAEEYFKSVAAALVSP